VLQEVCLYGGAIDDCQLTGSEGSGEVFNFISQYESDNTTSSISSDPFRICPCENNYPDYYHSILVKRFNFQWLLLDREKE